MKYLFIILLFTSCTVTHVCNCKPTTSPIMWQGGWPDKPLILPTDPPGYWGGPYYGPTPSLPIGIDTMSLRTLRDTTVLVTKGWTIKN